MGRFWWQGLGWAIATLLLVLCLRFPPVEAQTMAYCRLPAEAIAQKQALHAAALGGNPTALRQYGELVLQHQAQLQACRSRTWPRNQAIWLRLYACDARPGGISSIMDEIVNLGYNEVYVEVFYSGKVLLPAAENGTPWPSAINTPGLERVDLLAQAIQKGHERGLKVYAWMFTLNFGVNYGRVPGRQDALARNANGQTTQTVSDDGLSFDPGAHNSEQLFVDPYSNQARSDYQQLVQAVAQRKPDGILFDYVRYHRGTGSQSVASRVQNLWIYGQSSYRTLLSRATNYRGLDLMQRFLSRGYITPEDVGQGAKLYPNEGEPSWQGRIMGGMNTLSFSAQQEILQQELWYLTVAHAVQGVLDFLALAVQPVQQQGLAAGAVFFPEANVAIGQGFDSRLQPWDRFPPWMEWHPMSYGICGGPSCIVAQVQKVLSAAPPGTQVKPVLAGVWGRNMGNRPSLETQMAGLQQAFPQIQSVSHFAFSWQQPESDQARKYCRF